MLYRLMRNILFQMDAEKAHHLGLNGLKWLDMLGLSAIIYPKPLATPVQVMGLNFPNRVGLAAGLDKNGDYIDALAALGFGFVEIGTVTPRPQPGNPLPRLFRIAEVQAIINRMGFNNLGVEHLLEQVKISQRQSLIGINIGKNFDTPVDKAGDDYLTCLTRVYPYADYVTINISSPNTPGLRTLQFGEPLHRLLGSLKQQQARLQQLHQCYVPLAVKVSPDLTGEEVQQLADAFAQYQIDAVIATNTTLSRPVEAGLPNVDEAGGLSGQPLQAISTEIIRQFRQALPQNLPIIAAGGIMSGDDAQLKLDAGASLVQIYSGFIYQGPSLIREIVTTIDKRN